MTMFRRMAWGASALVSGLVFWGVTTLSPVAASPENVRETPIVLAASGQSTGVREDAVNSADSVADKPVVDAPFKPMLARANLPAVEQVLAVVKAAPAPLWSLKSPAPLDAPESAEAVLDSARAALEGGDQREAVEILIPLYDGYPGTQAISDANRLLMDEAERMVVEKSPMQRFEEFESGFPAWKNLGPGGKYAIVDYYKEVFYVAQKAGNEALAGPYRKKALESSRRLVYEHPDNPLQNSIVGSYYDYGVEEGGEALENVLADLEDLAARPQATMNRLGARYNLAAHAQNISADQGAYVLRMSEVVEDFDAGFVDGVFEDPTVIYWAKSWLLLSIGQALRAVGRYEDALDVYTEYDEWILGRAGGGIRIEMADLVKILNPQDPFVQAKAYEGIVASMSKGNKLEAEFRARALQKLGGVYLNYGDYKGAAQILEQLLLEHPQDKVVESVQQELDFIYENLHDSMEVYNFAPADKEVYAQTCGPRALQRWLAVRGTEAAMEMLAVEARNDQHGASMFGLMEAAKLHGLDTIGVAAESVDELPFPFLAHVDEEHFLLVLSREGGTLSISDNGGDPESLTLEDFHKRWKGKAIIERRDQESLAALTVLDLDTLKGARGGTGSSNDNNPPPPPPPGKKLEDHSSVSEEGQYGIVEAWNPWNGDTRYIPETGLPGAPDTATGGIAYSGVFVPNGFLSIVPSGAALQLVATDLRVPVRGDLQLVFTRHYVCREGFPDTEYTNTTKPWSNNIGKGWTHNFNIHLRTSTPTSGGYPTTIIAYDETGATRNFVRSATASTTTEDIYYRTTAVFPEEKRQVLVRNKTAGTYVLWMANNARFEFSVPTTTTDRFARLTKIADAHDNALTLEYDGAVGVGKLTKVYAPSGDSRFLEFTYTSGRITEASLKKGTTELAQSLYTYDGANELVEVEDTSTNTVAYTYGTNGSAAGSRFLTSITDKKAVTTNLTWAFSLLSGTGYRAHKITLDTADGRSTVYERSLTTNIATAKNYDGATALSKYVYTPVGATGMPWHVDYYQSGTATTFERWSYSYGIDGHSLEMITGPGSVVLADYTRDTAGRPTAITDVTGLGPTFTYASADDALPNTITRRDGTNVTLAYDANGRIENVLETGVANGTSYEYDSYGQIVTVTDPLGNDTTYTYDDMGNLLTTVDAASNTVTRTYDDFGNMLTETDAENNTTAYEYSDGSCQSCGGTMGLVVKITDAEDNETEYEYDAHGNKTNEIRPDDSEIEFTHDDSGRLTTKADASGTTSYAYDLLGRLESEESSDGRTKSYAYDNMGRVTSVDDGLVDLSRTYDSYGNPLTVVDANENTTSIIYDANMRKTQETDDVGAKAYTYDNASDTLLTVEDELDHVTSYEYDTSKRLALETSASGKKRHFEYDEYGRKEKTGAGTSGTVNPVEYSYDSVSGELTKARYHNGSGYEDVEMEYDAEGRTTGIKDSNSSVDGLEYEYNGLGRIVEMRNYEGAAFTYTYDELGRVLNINDYDGNDIGYSYDATSGKVSTITAPGGRVWSFQYDVNYRLESYDAPNGVSATYTYDTHSRVTKIEFSEGSTVLESYAYVFDAAGNVLSETRESGDSWEYTYDSRGRRTAAVRKLSEGSVLVSYAYVYDDANNLTSKTVTDLNSGVQATTYTYNADNTIASTTFPDLTTITYSYDDWGRVSSKTDGTHTATYAYGQGSELSEVTTTFPGEEDVTHANRGDGKRHSSTVNGNTTSFEWAPGAFPVGLNTSGGASSSQVFVPLDPAAPETTILAALDADSPATEDASYYFHDRLGSVRQTYNNAGSLTSNVEFDPFGASFEIQGTDTAPIGYKGAVQDTVTGQRYTPEESILTSGEREHTDEKINESSTIPEVIPDTANASALASRLDIQEPLRCVTSYFRCKWCVQLNNNNGGITCNGGTCRSPLVCADYKSRMIVSNEDCFLEYMECRRGDEDIDPPTVYSTAGASSASESDTSRYITLILPRTHTADVIIPYTVSVASTATVGVDYTIDGIDSSPLTIPAGHFTVDIHFNIINDAIEESDEAVIVTLGTPTNATLGATFVHTLVIEDDDDSMAPVVTLLGAMAVTVECGNDYTDAGATALDTEDGDLTANIVVSGDAVDPGTPGVYEIDFDVMDSLGNAAVQATRTVTVADTEAPTITLIGDTPVNVQLGGSYTDAGGEADDDCEGELSGSIVTTGTVDVNTAGTYTISYNLTDNSGNVAAAISRAVVVGDTQVPVITLTGGDVTVECGELYTDPGWDVSDNSGEELDGTVVVSGTVDMGTPGDYELTYNVSDSSGNAAVEVTRTVTVADTEAPTITLIGDTPVNVQLGGSYTDAGAEADDDCEGVLTGSIVTTGTVDVNTAGTYTISYNLTDNSGNVATTVSRAVVVGDTQVPVVTLIGGDVTVECGELFTDPGWDVSDNSGEELDGAVVVGGSVDTGTPGDYEFTYNVSDSSGNAAVQVTRTVTVADMTAPTITLIGGTPVNVQLGGTYVDAGAEANDDCEGDLTDSIVATGTADVNTAGSYTISYNLTDNSGNGAASVSRTVIVGDTQAPVITLIGGDVTVECGELFTDPGWDVSDTSGEELDGAVVVGGTVDTGTPGDYELTYNVSDSSGNAATQVTRTVTVADMTAPIFTLTGDASVSVECGEVYVDAGVSADDTCEGDLMANIVVSGDTVGTGTPPGVYEIDFDVMDGAGNAAATLTRVVTVADTRVPEIELEGEATVYVELGGTYTEEQATANDLCEGDLSANIIVSGDTVDTNTPGTYNVWYDVEDGSGNEAIRVIRTVHVVDPIVAYWPFDADAADSGANNFDLTLTNPQAVLGVVGLEDLTSALHLVDPDPATGLEVANRAETGSTALDLTGDASFMVWFMLSGTDVDQTILSKGDPTATGFTGYEVVLNPDGITGDKGVMLRYGDGTDAVEAYSSTNLDFIPGEWYHLAVVFDSAIGTADFYVNGLLDSTVTGLTTTFAANDADFRVGADAGLTDYLNGGLDELFMYQFVLTEGDVIEEYQRVTHTLTTSTTGSGSVQLSPAGGVYTHGVSVDLTAQPESEWLFGSWGGTDVGDLVDISGNAATILMNGNKSLSATFEPGGLEVSFSGSGSSVFEGDSGVSVVPIAVSLNGPATEATLVEYSILANSTAIGSGGDADYTLVTGSVSIIQGAHLGSIDVDVLGDERFESHDTLVLTLDSVTPASIDIAEPTTYTLAITNDDPKPTVGFSEATSSVGEGDGSTDLVISLSGSSDETITVDFGLTDGSATAGSDYTADSDTLTFAPGDLSKTITLAILEDGDDEGPEGLSVTLSNVTNAASGQTNHTLTIVDNESPVTFAASSSSAPEDIGIASIVVNADGTVAGNDVTVEYKITGGSATNGSDYVLADGTLNIPIGSASGTISFPIIDDALDDDGDTIELSLSNPQFAGLSTPKVHTLTIIDDDSGSPNTDFSLGNITSPGSGAKIKAGDAVSVTFALGNTGVDAPASMAVYLSRDGTLGTAPQKLLVETFIDVPTGLPTEESIVISSMPDVAPGVYYLLVLADANDDYPSESGSDNVVSIAVLVIDGVLTNE